MGQHLCCSQQEDAKQEETRNHVSEQELAAGAAALAARIKLIPRLAYVATSTYPSRLALPLVSFGSEPCVFLKKAKVVYRPGERFPRVRMFVPDPQFCKDKSVVRRNLETAMRQAFRAVCTTWGGSVVVDLDSLAQYQHLFKSIKIVDHCALDRVLDYPMNKIWLLTQDYTTREVDFNLMCMGAKEVAVLQ